MARPVFCAVLCSWLLMGLGAGSVRADAWTDALFTENRHDFGMVPRGVKVKHDFVMVNRLGEAITILNLRPSCGCTSGKASASQLGPGQSAVIEAEMDTRNFVGPKSTILYVTLITASGREGEARLGVSSLILSDIVLNPGAIDFGAVSRGQSPTRVLTIDRINAPGWKFVRMVSASRAINAQLAETARTASSVSYALTVSLKPDAPTGFMRDEIRLISNDAEAPSIPLMVTAWIRGDLTAAPSVVSLGQIHSVGRRPRPVRRPIVATVRDPVDRRGRRRVFDVASRRDAPADACRYRRLQARGRNDPRRHPPHLPRAHRSAGRAAS